MCLSTANLCYGAVADPSFAHGCYSFAIWSSTPSSSGRYYDLCVWNGRGQILERPAGYAFSVAVSCSLIKCVYLYNKTLKRLCNGYSSALGSIFCFDGVSLCRGSGSDGVTVDNCAVHDVWSGTAGGGGYYFLFNYHVLTAQNSYPANFAFSARCVRRLREIVFIVGSKL